MAERRKVALLVEWSRAYGRGVLHGIADYVQAHETWKIYQTERSLRDAAPAWLTNWTGDGIIARIENRKLAKQIKQMNLPTVDLFGHKDIKDVPIVITDDRAVVRLAADHLIDRGLKHFAYCGLHGIYSSEIRSKYFVDHLARAGYEAHVYENPRQRHTAFIATTEEYELQCEDAVAEWIRSLPKPVGLMACNDLRAHQILMACGDHGIAVPDEVAVIGVDNDEVICELCRPPLTSIELNPQKVGYEAAALLDGMLGGKQQPEEHVLVEPLGVVARQSTDVVALGDADLVAAVHFIREHACDGICVEDILRHVRISRSTLERRFTKFLGRSPRAEITRVRLQRVKQLLATTDYPLAKIAQLAGFQYMESMCCLFKKTVGHTPGQYRKELQTQ